MSFLTGAFLALTAALVALTCTKQTRVYEVLMLGGWGIATGALLAGESSLAGLSISTLWNAVF